MRQHISQTTLARVSRNTCACPGAPATGEHTVGHATVIGRVGGLAVALGIGAALAATPWTASAKPSVSTPHGPNVAVSIDGHSIDLGSATATSSGTDSRAFALGADASATAGPGDTATAIGTNATANATGGTGNRAFAFGTNSIANAGTGSTNSNNNTATATGTNAAARAGILGTGNNNNTATATKHRHRQHRS